MNYVVGSNKRKTHRVLVTNSQSLFDQLGIKFIDMVKSNLINIIEMEVGSGFCTIITKKCITNGTYTTDPMMTAYVGHYIEIGEFKDVVNKYEVGDLITLFDEREVNITGILDRGTDSTVLLVDTDEGLSKEYRLVVKLTKFEEQQLKIYVGELNKEPGKLKLGSTHIYVANT